MTVEIDTVDITKKLTNQGKVELAKSLLLEVALDENNEKLDELQYKITEVYY